MNRHGRSRPQDPEACYAEHEQRARRALADADFPLFGAAPAGDTEDRCTLAAWAAADGCPDWVELGCGDWASPHGPYVSVRTHRPGTELALALPDLEDVVEDERDRVYEQAGIDEGDGPGRVRALREWISVDGEPCAVQLHEDRRPPGDRVDDGTEDGWECPVWCGRLRVDGLVLTVTGRGVAPGAVELHRVGDLDPYVRGRTAQLRRVADRLAAGRVPVRERELPSPVGLEAHRAVVDHRIAEALALEAQLRAQRPARLPRRLRGEAGAELREAAVRQQMRLATESREEAEAAVSVMADHLARLARTTDWLVGTAEGEAAVAEVVRWTAFASEVASLPAQQAWARLRSGGDGVGASGAEEAWLSAWEQWRRERSLR
ncbi:hypothetical protein [Kitasatospora sp. NBC_01539]|uniref:hypothetical protein n=1 Tax=Kitasatospora sp. NBC_01539 TaxID=2903577 RepID=UPI003860320B